MSQHVEKALNDVMEALGEQKAWATCVKVLREQGFTVELAYTMEKIRNASQGKEMKTSYESLQDIRMMLSEGQTHNLEVSLRAVLERYGCKRPAAMAICFAQMVETLNDVE